jgi:microcystin-dependent protein
MSDVDANGIISAPRFISTQATGTAPFTVASTTAVTNLNADLLDGQHGSVYSPAGMISQFAGSSAPTGWLLCEGQAVSRTTFAALFSTIGTTYGSGDGSTTFNVPNLQNRVPVGKGPDTEFDALGETGGAKTHTLTEAQMPSHTHIQNSHNHTQNAHNHTQNAHNHSATTTPTVYSESTGSNNWDLRYGDGNRRSFQLFASLSTSIASTTATNQSATATNQATTATNQNTGGGQAHNNLQPYIVLNYIIKT